MIKVENVDIYGWEAAIRGMRNPHNSWDNSDSYYCEKDNMCNHDCRYLIDGLCMDLSGDEDRFVIGAKDLKRMINLVKAGNDHSKFMRMIMVTCDITAPLYWWKEFDTYKVGTVRNSCSTMHKIADKEFTLDDFSCEHLNPDSIDILKQTIDKLNSWRDYYVNYDRYHCLHLDKKDIWWQMIQLLPSSYNQRATVQLSYAVLRNMYHGRYTHKLDEWSVEGDGLCEWMGTLPYSELITMPINMQGDIL